MERLLFEGKASKFKYWLDLSELLLQILDSNDYLLKESIRWKNWRDASKYIFEKLKTDPSSTRAAPTKYGGNIMGGQLSNFRIISCLAANSPSEVNEHFNSLQTLILLILIERDNDRGLLTKAESIRLFFRPEQTSYKLVNILPIFNGSLDDYKDALSETSEKLAQYDNDLNGLSKSIQYLANKIPEIGSNQNTAPKFTHYHPVNNDMGDSDSAEPSNGIITPVIINPDTDEVNDTGYQWTENLSEDEAEPPQIETAFADFKLSRFWVRNHHNRTLFDKQRFTNIERIKLSNYIQNGLISENIIEQISSLIIGINYTTPLSLDESLSLINNTYLNIEPLTQIQQKITLPANAYMPPTDKASNLHAYTDHFQLPIHQILSDALCKISKSGTLNVLAHFKITKNEIRDYIDKSLSKLRQHNRYRIDKKRINSALSTELNLNNKNPIITYIITGTTNQAPPILEYYQAIPVNKLIDAYKNTIKGMLS